MQKKQCQVHAGEEGHARPGWATSRRGQDSPWKSQSEWQRTEINGEITFMVWPSLGSRTAKEQNRTEATKSFTQRSNKKGDNKLIAVTLLSNLNRFLKFLNRQIIQEICNKAITKDPTTPCIYCHTTRRRSTGFESQRLCDKRGNDRSTQALLFSHKLRHKFNSIQLNFTKSKRGRNGHLHRNK